jgi:RimJ/RimL family protein N-acetyltransferase
MTLPLGDPVPPCDTPPPARRTLEGRWISLHPLDPQRDAPGLFACSHGTPAHDEIWVYLAYGPFPSEAAMRTWLEAQAPKTDPLFFAVHDNQTGYPLGMVSYLNIVPDHRTIEVGHIWYGLAAQRTRANTEAIYLMLSEAFDRLHYRRMEWKCNALNARSRAAALRLGFQYEGVFRQHFIVKGRNRDTAWYSMLDSEWARLKPNYERWLYAGEDHLSLAELNRGG